MNKKHIQIIFQNSEQAPDGIGIDSVEATATSSNAERKRRKKKKKKRKTEQVRRKLFLRNALLYVMHYCT
jgi:hypothetical protein